MKISLVERYKEKTMSQELNEETFSERYKPTRKIPGTKKKSIGLKGIKARLEKRLSMMKSTKKEIREVKKMMSGIIQKRFKELNSFEKELKGLMDDYAYNMTLGRQELEGDALQLWDMLVATVRSLDPTITNLGKVVSKSKGWVSFQDEKL